MISQLVFSPFIFAFITSLAITYITILSYKAIGLVDKSTKKEHPKHIHTSPTPRGGGIPIFMAMLFVTLTFIKVDAQIAGAPSNVHTKGFPREGLLEDTLAEVTRKKKSIGPICT